MILSGEKIIAEGLVLNSEKNNYRATSYEVCIGSIIVNEEKSVKEMDDYKLLPQGIVVVVSKERVKLPKDITGYVMVKTSLCNEGILPLNIGIIDPGYEGPISTTLLNFSKKEFLLSKNKKFLRLVFHQCHESNKYGSKPRSNDEYLKEKKEKAINFAPQFLNLDSYIKDATKQFNEEFMGNLTKVSLLLALFSFLVALGVSWGSRSPSKEELKSEIIKEVDATRDSRLVDKIKELEEKIKKMETTPTP